MLKLNSNKRIPHIVLADDDPDECLTFMYALEEANIQHIFSLAENGAMLLNMLDERRFSPDIIFIDLNMKGISGKDCLLAIRSSKKLNKVPVIVFSSAANYLDVEFCYLAKANLYVVKNDFVLTLSKFLNMVLQTPLCELFYVDNKQFIKNITLS